MRSTSIIAALLTFFSFLLVLGAAVFFLLQGRQELRAQIFGLQEEVQAQNQSISEFQSTAVARDMALSTTQAQLSTNEAELRTRELELEQSQEELDNLQATQTAQAESETEEPPIIEILQPEDGAQITADSPLELLIVGGHPDGLNNLRLEIGERVITFQDNGADFRLFTHRILTLSPGQLVITATVTSDTDLSASDAISVTVQEPTPTPEPATATPEAFIPRTGLLFSQYSSDRQQFH